VDGSIFTTQTLVMASAKMRAVRFRISAAWLSPFSARSRISLTLMWRGDGRLVLRVPLESLSQDCRMARAPMILSSDPGWRMARGVSSVPGT